MLSANPLPGSVLPHAEKYSRKFGFAAGYPNCGGEPTREQPVCIVSPNNSPEEVHDPVFGLKAEMRRPSRS